MTFSEPTRPPIDTVLIHPPSTAEEQRLVTLRQYNLLATSSNHSYDRITKLACRLFSVPICFISLVDENGRWFKSQCGFYITETDRSFAIYSQNIQQKDIMVVPDASLDQRFTNNPSITGFPEVRFYASAPLCTIEGHTVGTICLIDHQPRAFNAAEMSALQDLAGIVVNEMELRLKAKALVDANEKLAHQANHDPLTNLANRSLFDQLLHTALRMAAFHHDNVGVLYMDLNHFKPINDQFGHAAGDQLLRDLAIRLSAVMLENSTFCRLGGDEFVVLLPVLRDEIEHVLLAAEINYAMERPFIIESRKIQMNLSIGTAIYPSDGDTPHLLLQAADASMYRAKASAFRYQEPDGTVQSLAKAHKPSPILRQRIS